MTDAVDILMIGGPADGRMVCMNLKSITTYATFPLLVGIGGEVTYTLRKWAHPLTQQVYRIGVREDDPITDEQILVAVVFANFPPAWDCNPRRDSYVG